MILKILLIIVVIVLFLAGLVFLGYWIQGKQVKRLIKERDNLDLSIPENRNRLKVLNKRIDKIYNTK